MDIVGISHDEQVFRLLIEFSYVFLLLVSEIPCLFPAQIIYQEGIFRTLAAILHLGNVEFSSGREHDSSVVKDLESRHHLQMAADLFKYIKFSDSTHF